MRKYALYLEFIFICFIFIIPPLFASPLEPAELNISFSWFSCVSFIAALLLFFQYEYAGNKNGRTKVTPLLFLLSAGNVFLYFGILIIVHVLVSAAAFLCGVQQAAADFSHDALHIFAAVFTFLTGAFYEETLYRLYFPSVLKSALNGMLSKRFSKCAKKKSEKSGSESGFSGLFRAADIAVEIFCNAVFALSHRYLGIPAVINAFLCGAVLRLCVLKNKNVLTGSASHALYNTVIFLSEVLL